MASPTPTLAPSYATRKYLSIKEAAYELGVGYQWLFRRIGTTKAPKAIRRGKAWMFDRTEVAEWSNRERLD